MADHHTSNMMKPVDLVHLARQTFGDADLEREVLRLFVTQSKLYLSRLKGAENVQDWREAAHTIKGSARGIGAWQVAEAAESAESARCRPGSKRADEVAGALEVQVGEAERFIDELFAA